MNRNFIDSNIDNEDAIMKYFNLMERLSKKDERFATQMEKDADYIEKTYDMDGGSWFSRWRERMRARRQDCPELAEFIKKYGKIMESIPKVNEYLKEERKLVSLEHYPPLNTGQIIGTWREIYSKYYKFLEEVINKTKDDFEIEGISKAVKTLNSFLGNKGQYKGRDDIEKFIVGLISSLDSFLVKLNNEKKSLPGKCATRGLENL